MQAGLTHAFARQRTACAALGAPFMAGLMAVLPELLPQAPRLVARMAAIGGEPGPSGASLPLRLAAGLHALVLSGAEPGLAAV